MAVFYRWGHEVATSPSAVDDWVEVPPATQSVDDDWIEVPPTQVASPSQTGPRKRNEGAGKPPAGSPTYLPPGGIPPIIQGALGVEGEPKSIPGQVVKAGAQMAESLTMDPVNVGISVATGGLGLLSKLPLLKAALPKAISVGFSAQMLNSAYEQSKEFRDAIDQKNYPKAAHALTTGLLDTVMSAMGLRHAAGIGEKATPVRAAEEPSVIEPKVAPVDDWIEVPPVQHGQVENKEVVEAPATPREEVVQPKPSAEVESAGAGEVPSDQGGDQRSEQPGEVRPSEGSAPSALPVSEGAEPEPVRGLQSEVGREPGGVESQPVAGDQGANTGTPGVEDSKLESKPKIEIERAKDLRPEEREAETRYVEKIQADPDAVIKKYREDNTKNGTLTINTDNARELSDDYGASNEGRTAYSRAVHEPSSWVAKKVYEESLKEPAPEGMSNSVLFTGGGTGAGKSVTVGHIDPDNPPQIIYDTNLNNTKSAKSKIDQALDAGKKVDIFYVHRGIEPAFESMMHRAMRMGRPVPIENHIETHVGAPKTLLDLEAAYKDNRDVNIKVIDNTGSSPADAKVVPSDVLRDIDYTGVRDSLERAADKAYADGRISAEVYRSIRGKAPGESVERSTEQPAALRIQGSREPGSGTRYGRSTEILIPGSPETYQAIYSVRDLDDVHASHSGQTFQKNPKFEFQNDRDYSDKRNSGRILSQAGDFKPQYLLTDSPDALNGAPIIDRRGNVLGGNSRTMTLDRVYAQKPEAASKYKQQLMAQAKAFGIDPATVSGMKRPVLVRELRGEFTPQKAVTDFNVAGTAALTPAERAVADSHRVSLKTLDEVAKRIESQGPDGTLAKALAGDGRTLVNRLVEDGAVAAQDKPALLNPDGTFSAEGKSRLSRLLIGRLFEDSKQFDTTAPELRNKLERIVAPLARVEGKSEWDISPTVKEAISLINEAKARDIGIDDLLAQSGMFDQSEYSPAAVAVAKSLSGKATEVAKAFRNYAEEAEMATTGTEAGIDTRLLTAKIPTQLEAFNEAFKSDLTEPIKGPGKELTAKGKTKSTKDEDLPQPWEIPASDVVPYADTVPKPKYKPETKGGYSEEELHARSIRNRAAETEPPEVKRFPIGTWRLDSTGELSQLKRLSLDDSRVYFPEELPNQRNQTVQKYIDWMRRLGEESPPVTALETDKGGIKISDGHHRVAAIKAMGGDSFEAWVTATKNVKRPSGAVMPEGLTHERAVRTAIEEGKDVPAKVLADYPDLIKPAEKKSGAVKYDKSSTQANLPPDMAEKAIAASEKIPDSELAEDGREKEPHITVLYGTDTDNPSDVAKLMEGERPIKAKIGAMSIFQGKNGDPDVVKLDVESTDLRRLNAKIKKNLPNDTDFPAYKPHVTLAYVKPGEGSKYAGRPVPGLSGKEVTLDSVHFSPKEGEKTEIPLSGKESVDSKLESPKETKPSKLAQGVEEKAIANKLTAGFEGKPEYETIKVADQAKMAADLINSDPEKAVRIAMGTEPPPDGLLPESMFVAVEDYATAKKDIDLLRDLATKSTLSSEATEMGQRIRMLAERDPNSPVAAIQKVTKAREEVAAKRFGPKAKDTIKKQIRVEIKKANAKPRNWSEWVDSIKCEV